MKNILAIIFLAVLLLLPGQAFSQDARKCDFSPEERLFVDLLELTRSYPAEVAQALGVDLESLYSQRPEMKFLLSQELPMLHPDARLCASTAAHARDMLKKGYYSRVGPDGSMPADRASVAGYEPVLIKEDLRLLGFSNYIEPDTAVSTLLVNYVLNELNSADIFSIGIFNPWFRDLGLSIDQGFLASKTYSGNAYLSVLDLAAENDVVLEERLRHAINRVRLDPGSVLHDQDMDGAFCTPGSWGVCHVPDQGMKPLSMSAELTDRARSISVKHVGLQHEDPAERYKQRRVWIPLFPDSSEDELIHQVMKILIWSEHEAASGYGEAFILNREFTSSGIAVQPKERSGENGLLFVFLLAGGNDRDFLMGRLLPHQERLMVQGIPVTDQDQDLSGIGVYLRTIGGSSLQGFALSGPGGFYQMELPVLSGPFGVYDLKLKDGSGNTLHWSWVIIYGGNKTLDIPLTDNSGALGQKLLD